MGESAKRIQELQQRVARLAGRGQGRETALFQLGHADADGFLGGGLGRGRLHEIFVTHAGEVGSGAGFAAMLARRALEADAALLWLRTDRTGGLGGGLYAPGLAEIGINVGSLILGLAPDEAALLRSAVDAARCAALGAVVIDCPGSARLLDLTASRRLALAAEKSGVTLLLLRGAAEPAASAAETRWLVGAAPSEALDANAPGRTMLDVELQRRRGGPAGRRWRVEWDRDQRCFRDPALPRPVVPLPARRPAGDRAPQEWRLTA